MSEQIQAIRGVIEKHTKKLNIIKENRAKSEDANEIEVCDQMIITLAAILSDLNQVLGKEEKIDMMEGTESLADHERRARAIKWFDDLKVGERVTFMNEYGFDRTRTSDSLTGREIQQMHVKFCFPD